MLLGRVYTISLLIISVVGYFGAGESTRGSMVALKLLNVRGGAKERRGLGSSVNVEGEEQPASAVEIITLADNRGFLVRKKTSPSGEDFFIATTEQDATGNYTLQLVPSSSSSGRKASILNDAVKSLQGQKEHAVLECDGLFGVYHLPSGYYLAVITKSSKVGSDSAFPTFGMDTDIREVAGLSLIHIPCHAQRNVNRNRNSSPAGTSVSAKQVGKEVTIATEMLLNTVSRHSFYFVGSASGESLGYDITRNMQAQAERVVETPAMAGKGKGKKRGGDGKRAQATERAWDQCDERFFWNLHAVSSLAEAGLGSFIVPVTNAWTASCELLMDSPSESYRGRGEGAGPLRLGLISRRSRHRQGQRYIKRGSDEAGDVANFVETEQILFAPPAHDSASASVAASASSTRPVYLSLVQLRGSIPIFWTQPETWRLKPEIVPMRNLLLHARALKTHLVDLFLNYFSGAAVDEAPSAPAQGQKDAAAAAEEEEEEEEERPSLFFVNLIDKSGMQGRLGRWLLAAFDRVHRGGVDCVSRAPSSGTGTGTGTGTDTGFGTHEMHGGDSSARDQLLAHFDDLPMRVEREQGLRDRRHVTVKDFACTIRGTDVEAVNGVSPSSSGGTGRSSGKGALALLTSRFIWFDYHKKCSKGAVHNLAQLLAPLRPAVRADAGAYAVLTADRRLLSPQRTMVRTNCVDCLDRTNVVQTTVARWVLLTQLDSLGVRRPRQSAGVKGSVKGKGTEEKGRGVEMSLPWDSMETQLRRLWGNNGDAMSMLYAGTPALKRDVTRTGKRTNQGVFDDGMNSAMRYYINNYRDEQTQRELDFTLGHHAPVRPGRVFLDRGDREAVRRTLQGHRGGVISSVGFAAAAAVPRPRVRQEKEREKEKTTARVKALAPAQGRRGAGSSTAHSEPPTSKGSKGELQGRGSIAGEVLLATAMTTQKLKREQLGRLLGSLTLDMQTIQATLTSSVAAAGNSSSGSSSGGIVNVDGKAALLGLEGYLNSSLQELTAKVVSAPRTQISTAADERVEVRSLTASEKGDSIGKEEVGARNKREEKKNGKERKPEKDKRKASTVRKSSKSRPTTAAAAKSAKASKPLAKVVLPNIIKKPILPKPKSKGVFDSALGAWRNIHPGVKLMIVILLLAVPLFGVIFPIKSQGIL
jgi:hypothetical protein